MINRTIRHLRRRNRRTDAERTQRQLRRMIQEAATATHRNDLLAVAAQAHWWR